MSGSTYDIAVIGGGIAGCAVARDAAGRGLRVFLCDQGDLGGGASSSTGRITVDSIPGTRRPWALLASRRTQAEEEVLLRAAPHVVRPLRLVVPRRGGVRAQLRRLGLFAHGRFGGRKVLPPLTTLNLSRHAAGKDLRSGFRFAQEFSACSVDDARLAILNAVDARARGAVIRPRTRCVTARREGWFWKLTLESVETGERWKIVARALVNAAGALVGDVLGGVVHGGARPELSFLRSSYIIVPRDFGHDRGYALAGRDGRVVLAIPYERDFTLIGPSVAGHVGDPGTASATIADIEYLLNAVGAWFKAPVAAESVAWTYAGVHAVRASRGRGSGPTWAGDIERDAPEDLAPLVSILSVPMLGHRLTAERVLDAFKDHLTIGAKWTLGAPLPGGHFAVDGMVDLVRALRAAYPFVAEIDAERMVSAYGTRAPTILTGARRAEDLGHRFGAGLTEAEVNYLMNEEWARTATDVLWRRTGLGLRMSAADAATLDLWMARARQPVAAPAA